MLRMLSPIFFTLAFFHTPDAWGDDGRGKTWSECQAVAFTFPEKIDAPSSRGWDECHMGLTYKLKSAMDMACTSTRPVHGSCKGRCTAIEYPHPEVVKFLTAYDISVESCEARKRKTLQPLMLNCAAMCTVLGF